MYLSFTGGSPFQFKADGVPMELESWQWEFVSGMSRILKGEPSELDSMNEWETLIHEWAENNNGYRKDQKDRWTIFYCLAKIGLNAESPVELRRILKAQTGISFSDYANLFPQRFPRYTVKMPGRTWHTKNKMLTDRPIMAHLKGQYDVGTLARWYPEFGLLDFDNKSRDYVESVRASLAMNENNSMLFTSESINSYHLLFRPRYNGKPPTRRLFNHVLREHADRLAIEVFPQDWKTVRLPFGPKQICVDDSRLGLSGWKDAVYWFQKLDDYDIYNLRHQMMIDLRVPRIEGQYTLNEGKELFEYGLQAFGTRNESQFKVIYYLWRQNIPPNVAREMVQSWIKNKNNGFSKSWNAGHFSQVDGEIERQIRYVYENYERAAFYPDTTHQEHNGYISKPDIEEIIKITGASRARMKFLFQLVKYVNPRRYRVYVPVHTDKLVEWASMRTYNRYLRELEAMGILERGTAYSVGVFSKNIAFKKWTFSDSNHAVLYDGRSVDAFESAIPIIYKPRDFRELIESAGAKRTTALEIVKSIYGKNQVSKKE